MTLCGISNLLNALIEKVCENDTSVERCAADEEVFRGWPPSTGKPVGVGLKTTRSDHDRLRKDSMRFIGQPVVKIAHPIIIQFDVGHRRFVHHGHAEFFGGSVIRINETFTPAQEKRVRARQRERSRQ